MEFVLIRKIYVEVDLVGTHPGLIDKRAFVNSSLDDLKITWEHDELTILQKGALHLKYRYRLDQHTYITVIEELIEIGN